jgi:putative transposase
LILLLTEGQVSDYRGAATVLPDLPEADRLIADKGYDSDWFREALTELEITPCIPGRANRKAPVPYDANLYKQRNRIEPMFGRLKDWRRIATRYDRCAHTFMSAICICTAPGPLDSRLHYAAHGRFWSSHLWRAAAGLR